MSRMTKGEQEVLEHHYARVEKFNRFHCYERNDPEACHQLADFLEKRKKKYEEAFAVYKENCLKHEYGKSCFQYGQFLFYGTGVKRNIGEAFKAHVKGCEVKNYSGSSCDTVAVQYLNNNAHPEIKEIRGKTDPRKAVKLFAKACDAEDAIGCAHAATAYSKGIEKYVKPDPELAFKFAFKACDFRNREGCKIVADAYKTGSGTEKNEKLYEYYQRQYDLMASARMKTKESI